MENVTRIPRGAIRLNVVLQIAAMAILVGAVNYFSFNHYTRADFSRSQKFVLADQTKRVIRELKTAKPLRIIVFSSPSYRGPETQIYPDVQNLLRELIFSGRERIEVEFVDQTRDLTRARQLQGQYKFSADESVLILDYEGRTKFVPVAEMADFDMTPLARGEPPRLLAFKGEQALTNAMMALVSPETRKAYFLEGHGEPPIVGTTTPLLVLRDYIERQNVSVQPLSLASVDNVPADGAALVIAAPQSDLSEREIAIVEQYWNTQGRLLILLDPKAPTPRLQSFLNSLGILPQDNRVLRVARSRLLEGVIGIYRIVTGEFSPFSVITKRLVGMEVELPGDTQSLTLDTTQAEKAGVQLWPLIQAAEEFWGESEYVTDENKGVRYDEGRDIGFPVYVAAAAARGGVADDRIAVESAKLVVTGNSEFALDVAQTPPGMDFLVSSMNWLFDRDRYTGAVPKTIQHFNLNVSEAQVSTIALYVIVLIPGAVAVMGLIAWWRRRA